MDIKSDPYKSIQIWFWQFNHRTDSVISREKLLKTVWSSYTTDKANSSKQKLDCSKQLYPYLHFEKMYD